MEKKYHNVLPIGSIVKIKNVLQLIMVINYNSTILDNSCLYSGVLYPEGFTREEDIVSFNDDVIEEVLFLGTLNFS